MPVSVQEAMALEIPCVTFRIRGCRELIEDDVSGILVPFGDVNLMSQKLDTLLSSPEKMKQLGTHARQRIISEYTKQAHVERQMPYYLEYRQGILK